MADLWHKNFSVLSRTVKKLLAPPPPATPKAKVVGGGEAQPKCSCKMKKHARTCRLSMWEALQTAGTLLPKTTSALLPQALPGGAKQAEPAAAQGSASKSAPSRVKIPKLAAPAAAAAAEASPAAAAAAAPAAAPVSAAAPAAAAAAAPAPAGQCLYLCNFVNTWPHPMILDARIISGDGGS